MFVNNFSLSIQNRLKAVAVNFTATATAHPIYFN